MTTVDYRYHWMDRDKQILRRRWDSTPDHPELENFPHPIHNGDEVNVVAGHPLGLLDLWRWLENNLST